MLSSPYLTVSIPSSIEIPVPVLLVIFLVILITFIFRERHLVSNSSVRTKLQNEIGSDEVKIPVRASSSSSETLSTTDNMRTIVLEKRASLPRNLSYRMEEEDSRTHSSEYTRRGQLWSKHASWKLPKAPRLSNTKYDKRSRYPAQGLEQVVAILKGFDVDPRRGFLPSQDPLQRLPYARYHLWEDLADDLPKLLGARLGQARGPLKQLPALLTDKLVTDAELRRAHLLLCLFAHAYIWGGPEPLDVIPEGIAKPLWEVSNRLGMPPVLGHPSIVLYNWRRLDAEADICMENLSTLNNFFDGRDESWFYLITVELEQRGAASMVPMMLSIDAIQRYHEEAKQNTPQRVRAGSVMDSVSDDMEVQQTPDPVDLSDEDDYSCLKDMSDSDSGSGDQDDLPQDEEALIGELTGQRVAAYVSMQLQKVAEAIMGMCLSMGAMREGCHPFIFYHRVRPFLSAWKQNPTLPNGVIYQGVSTERQQFYGGSAAQSSLLPFLDISLGVSHESTKSLEFLMAMRDYMPRRHREFLEYLETVACVRQFIIDGLMSRGITSELRAETDIKAPRTPQQAHRSHLGSGGQCIPGMGMSACPAQPLTGAELRAHKERKVWLELRDAYDSCIDNLQAFRSSHMSIVADYIIAQQKKGVNKDNLEGSAGGKGTGGTDLMKFLKPIRDNCGESLLSSPVPKQAAVAAEEPYIKDNGCSEDIDLFRGAAKKSGPDSGWDVATTGPIVFTLSQQ